MPSIREFRAFCVFVLSAALLSGVASVRLASQAATGTILGTVTDSSGATVPDTTVRITNVGTAATQIAMTDSQGLYRVPALPIGDYDVQAEKTGFETVLHRGVTLTVGRELVVDFSMPVGQLAQTVTVEGEVQTIDTTTSTISNLVEPTQMRELPLNGRNFEQLILLAPGVTIMQAIGLTATNGFGSSYSISGSRTRGQAELMDDNDIMNYQDRNAGSGVLGSSLGVDAIAEFEVLTNTYSAQYGGNGGVINSVTKSGTNDFHGSTYEFFRNSALDAKNFFDPPQKPLLQKNQFGATLGGPIKKDKLFFFANYEGVRANTGTDTAFILPDSLAHSGFAPNSAGTYVCAPTVTNANPAGTIPYLSSGANNAACAATIPASVLPYLNLFPSPSLYPNTPNVGGVVTAEETANYPGSENFVVGRADWEISSKDSAFARYLFDRGKLFEAFDSSTLSPAAPQAWGTNDSTQNQFLSIEEKHIKSSNVITSSRFGFSRTFLQAYSAFSDQLFEFDGPNLWNGLGFPTTANGSFSITPQLLNPNYNRPSLGGGSAFRDIQNKFSGGEDIFWNRGAHGLRFGGFLQKLQTYGVTAPSAGAWSFPNISALLQGSPVSFSGTCVATIYPACSALPLQTPQHHFTETDFAFYIQDDWKATRTLTFNIGLRYSPTTDPKANGYTLQGVNLPLSATYNPALPMPGCTTAVATPLTPSTPTSCIIPAGTLASTPIHTIYLSNPSFHNFDPRIGLAWDPFKDHKTSIRAGYGIFHSPVTPFDYANYINSVYVSVNQSCASQGGCGAFPVPFQTAANLTTGTQSFSGVDPGDKQTPYQEQWNLTVQRQIGKDTMISVGYVGSHGVHLIGYVDENPALPSGEPGAITVCAAGCNMKPGQVLIPYTPIASQLAGTQQIGGFTAITATPAAGAVASFASANGQPIVDPSTGQNSYSNVVCNLTAGALTGCNVVSNNRGDPALTYSVMRRTTFFSSYNSLQASFVRRISSNFQFQASYTYGECTDNSSGSQPLENGEYTQNPYNTASEKAWCGYMIRNTLYANGMYILPFHKDRLVSGWQVGGIFNYHTGTPMWAVVGWQSGLISSGVNNQRPNVVPGCNPYEGTISTWINPSCFTMPPVGEPGNSARSDVFGPHSTSFDFSVTKNTKISERFNLQFRSEFFNLFNHVNFRNPAQPVINLYSEASPLPPSCATTPTNCSVASALSPLTLTDTSARQIQFGLKLIF